MQGLLLLQWWQWSLEKQRENGKGEPKDSEGLRAGIGALRPGSVLVQAGAVEVLWEHPWEVPDPEHPGFIIIIEVVIIFCAEGEVAGEQSQIGRRTFSAVQKRIPEEEGDRSE